MRRDEADLDPVSYEVIRNRMVAITEEMRMALQAASGSPTVTEASDFFTGLFLPDGSVASMGFQVAYHAPVCSQFVRYITHQSGLSIRPGDMFIGNDPYIAALHQNDVQMVAPIFIGSEIIAWAGVEAHETDVGGMDFASWSPRAREIFQEGLRIPCVKLVDQGELRTDVLGMILTASRLPAQLNLDIRAFIATLSVARDRLQHLVSEYDEGAVKTTTRRMIESSEQKMRKRLRELPDGEFVGVDFLEHDGHSNALYEFRCRAIKRGDKLTLDYSGTSAQAPGFINSTRVGLVGAVCGSVLPTLAWDMQWNQGALAPVEIKADEGLVCTAKHPAPVGSATVEAIWVAANATMQALNKMLQTSPIYAGRAQGVNAGVMATFNLGGINQFGERFGLHLMDPLAAGSAAWPDKDGVNAGGPITSPFSGIADVERNEQVSPLFYHYRRLARDTGGAGRQRGGVGAEIALSLGGISSAEALVMTHGAEVPNGAGLGGGWPGATVMQAWSTRDAAGQSDIEYLGPKPGLRRMSDADTFLVAWQGGGGYGDPLDRVPERVGDDVARGLVSELAAEQIFGVVFSGGDVDREQTGQLRQRLRRSRLSDAVAGSARWGQIQLPPDVQVLAKLGDNLSLLRVKAGPCVVTSAGAVLAEGHTDWRLAAPRRTYLDKLPHLKIHLHAELAVTCFYCPISGAQLCVDVHRRTMAPQADVILSLSGGR